MGTTAQRVARRYLATILAKTKDVTLYYIGKRPASPKPKRPRGPNEGARKGDMWERPWLDKKVKSGVFMTDDPVQVAMRHGVAGNVYAYKVPRWVLRESGGIHAYDNAREVLVPKKLWENVQLQGKSMGAKELSQKVEKRWSDTKDRLSPPPRHSEPKPKPEKPPTSREKKEFEQWASKKRYPNPLPERERYQNRITFKTLMDHANSENPAVKARAQKAIDQAHQSWKTERR